MMQDLIPLNQLTVGQTAQIGELLGVEQEVQRLEEIGFRRGRSIEMVQSGSPCIIRVDGTKVCFRSCDLFSVLVQPGAVS